MAVRDGVGGAGFHAIPAENAAVVIDVVNLGVALPAGDAEKVGVLRGLDVDAVGGAGGGTQEAGHAFFEAVGIALEYVDAAVALFKLGRLVGIGFRHGGRNHLLERDAHPLGDGGGGIQNLSDGVRHGACFYFSVG